MGEVGPGGWVIHMPAEATQLENLPLYSKCDEEISDFRLVMFYLFFKLSSDSRNQDALKQSHAS